MKERKLGKKGFNVSEIGLGCWQLGADWGDPLSKDSANAILAEAVENGITFFDTADVYGNGKSETLIGEFLKTTKANVKVATKYGRMQGVYPDHYTEKTLRECVDASLKRLQTDTIDLLQLHCIPTQILKEGKIFDWLRNIKDEGLIANFGASVETIEEGLLCMQQEELLSLQVIFNILRQKPLEKLFPMAREKGIGIIVRLPLASGLLTGKFDINTVFAKNDHRNYNKDGEAFNVGETFGGIPFKTGVELSDTIKTKFLPQTMSMVQLALRWILDQEAVSTVIPGASSPKQVQSNAAVSQITPLSTELHTALANFYTKEVHQHIRGVY